MFLITRTALIGILLVQSPIGTASDAEPAALVSLNPEISFVAGSVADRLTALDAVGSFVGEGLALPDLEIRFHADSTGCGGHRGLFHHNDGEPAIDLCFEGEFLVLHELGHAWEHFNLDDLDRARFQQQIEAPTWNAADTPHSRRAIEIAADTLAHGLLSEPLTAGQNRDREFAQYESLTGIPTHRATSLEPLEAVSSIDTEQLDRAATYAEGSRATAAIEVG